MTPRQGEVVTLIRQGLGTKEIAERLGVSGNAVKAHVTKLLRKFGVTNRAALVEVLSQETQQERQRLQELLRSAPVRIVFTSGPDHRIEFANQAYLDGRTEAEAFGRPLGEVFPGHPSPLREQAYRTGATVRSSEHLVLRRDADGTERDQYFTAVHEPLRDAHGQVNGMATFVIDVTEAMHDRQRISGGLSDEQRALLDLLPNGVLISDPQGRYTMNRAALRMFGFVAPPSATLQESIPSELVIDASTGVSPDFGHSVIGKAFGGESPTATYRYRPQPAAPERWIRTSAAPVRNADGAIVAAVATLEDVTDQERFGRAFAAAPIPMALADGELTLVAANTAFARRLGLASEELLGGSLASLLPGEEVASVRYLTRQAVAGRISTFKLEERLTSPGRRVAKSWQLSATPLPADDDRIGYVLFALTPAGATSEALGQVLHTFRDPVRDLRAPIGERLARWTNERDAAVVVLDLFDPLVEHPDDLTTKALAEAKARVSEVLRTKAVEMLSQSRFVAVLPGTAEEGARTAAERLRAALEVPLTATTHALGTSVGIALSPQHGTWSEVVRLAAGAAYVARIGGRGVEVFRTA